MPLADDDPSNLQMPGQRARGSDSPPRESSPTWVRYGRSLALVFEFTGTIAAGVLVGHLLDRTFDTEPQFVIGLTLLAVVGGFFRLVWVLRRMERVRD